MCTMATAIPVSISRFLPALKASYPVESVLDIRMCFVDTGIENCDLDLFVMLWSCRDAVARAYLTRGSRTICLLLRY
jgi:hypothetical protein